MIGTRGGVGSSTIATSLAWLFSADDKRSTALLDLDIHFGTGALALDLEPGRGLTDAIENPSRIDGLFIERAMIRANDNLALLSAEAPINSPLMTDGSAFMQLEEEFRQAFELTVVDLPRNMLINFPQLLADVNVVVLVTEYTLASARDSIRILSWLKSNASHAKVVVVANKVQTGVAEISKADFEASIECPVQISRSPTTSRRQAMRQAGPDLLGSEPLTKAGVAIREVADGVLGTRTIADEGGARKSGKTSLLGKFDLKSMLPKKIKSPTSQEPMPSNRSTPSEAARSRADSFWLQPADSKRIS